ncbi:hypothetical protein [Vulcanisaeta sp. JCM 14467]|uniref:hypothetical protein n=1 Tax=Vulcanisaeta sp. JCM 14467 TaxID=1295370 RepID=UPI000A98CD32|nr:hypothetical protein [Vulcanisaeta sp. JCM 14467]
MLGSQVSEPGSLYYYYDNGTWALVRYSVWYIDPRTGATEYLGSTIVSEVLYVPEYDSYGVMFDYGNGTISLLYYSAMPWIKEYIGYSTLNVSSVTYYANFAYASTGSEQLYECNGPVDILSGIVQYQVLLGGTNTAIAPGLVTIYNPEPFTSPLGINNVIPSIAGMASSPTLFNSQSMWIEFFNVGVGTNLYISVINASAVYGLPTFGFILNATHYYGNPRVISCKYGKLIPLG